MPINLRGSTFQATVHHQGQRLRKSFALHGDAVAWHDKTREALRRGESIGEDTPNVKGHPRTMQELFTQTHRKYWLGASSESSAVINADKCMDVLGRNTSPAAINEQRIDEMTYAFESEGIAPATINRRLSALSKMLTFAYERGFIMRKPKIDRKKEPSHRVRYITGTEEANLIEYFNFIARPDMAEFIQVGIDTGARLSELHGIKAIDIDRGILTLPKTKNGTVRTIPLTKRANAILTARAEACETSQSKVWEGYTNNTVRHLWQGARSHLKLMTDPQFVPHTMRHSFCSRLVQRGVDILTVSQLAGHKSISVTMRYSHLKPANLINAIAALDAQEVA